MHFQLKFTVQWIKNWKAETIFIPPLFASVCVTFFSTHTAAQAL